MSVFDDAAVLAPMVRINTLPFRLLAREMGADLVFTEELIDLKMVLCQRTINSTLQCIDYVHSRDGSVVFRTVPAEKDHLVFQMGTADPQSAVAAALLVYKDVAAIDVNMGCPQRFSNQGGMGTALLTKPEKAQSILTALVTAMRPFSVPVTCKIRVLEDIQVTLDFCRLMASTGISALTVHGRTPKMKDPETQPADWQAIRKVVALVQDELRIPVIANGDVLRADDVDKIRRATGARSAMLGRSAMANASVFNSIRLLRSRPLTRDAPTPGAEIPDGEPPSAMLAPRLPPTEGQHGSGSASASIPQQQKEGSPAAVSPAGITRVTACYGSDGLLSPVDVSRRYLQLAFRWKLGVAAIKYALLRMLPSPRGKTQARFKPSSLPPLAVGDASQPRGPLITFEVERALKGKEAERSCYAAIQRAKSMDQLWIAVGLVWPPSSTNMPTHTVAQASVALPATESVKSVPASTTPPTTPAPIAGGSSTSAPPATPTLAERAHAAATKNRDDLAKSTHAVCYCCCRRFTLSELTHPLEYTGDDCALCPTCGVDCVVGSASGLTLTDAAVRDLAVYWFGKAPEPMPVAANPADAGSVTPSPSPKRARLTKE